MKPAILLIDDDPSILKAFSRFLTGAGYDVDEAASLAEAKEHVSSGLFDAVILDLYLPDGKGIDWIAELRADFPGMAIVLITGQGDIPVAVEAMQRGGDHFLTKPVDMLELDVFLRKALEMGELRRMKVTCRRMEKKSPVYFGENPEMKKVEELARMAAETETPVLIQGETGTGKGVLGRWIHDHSDRGSAPWVEVNCSGLRGEMLASELFGHVKGAFTSAVQSGPRCAGPVPEGDRGEELPPPRRREDEAERLPPRLRHQPGVEEEERRGRLPARPPLPHQHLPRHRAAPA
jgi:two-component system response regulator HydG